MHRFAALLACVGSIALLGPTAAAAASSAENYRLYCVQCHGTSGNGQGINADGLAVSPRDHTSAVEMTKLTDEEIRLAIANGGEAVRKSELMPPWSAVLSANEIDELIAYTRKLCKCTAAK